MQSEPQAIAATRAWVENIVVGLNFCPFAKREMQRNSIRYALGETNNKAITNQFIDELQHLDSHPETETTLIVYEQALLSFEDYLDVLATAEAIIEQGGYAGIYQVASFHPDYVFEGESENAPSNYTNRSPFPLIHILRESSLTRVLNTYSDPESIPANNIEKANQLGADQLQSMLTACLAKPNP